MEVHQCPRCELRFVTTSELRHHFDVDHAADPGVFERYRYRSGPSAAARTRTVLLVGNQTLGRDEVIDDVVERAAGGAHVVVLVPATHPGHREDHSAAPPAEEVEGDEAGVALARWRVRNTVERLRAAGVDAVGEVGSSDPYNAVSAVIAREPVQEILLSTLPRSSSRWLEADLPERLRRHTTCEITVLTGAPAARAV